MTDISGSIVLYNNDADEVRKPVENFLNCSLNAKIYLVDNSEDDRLRYQFISPKIEYIFCGKNLGYGAGHNLAIEKAIKHSKYHIVMNPDIEFSSEVISRIYHFMQQNPGIGLVMPKVLYRNGDLQYLCKKVPSPADVFLRRFLPRPLKLAFRSYLEAYELRHRDYDSIMEVPNLSGCFMFLRSEVFQKVGMFDERFFLYFEDTDLCRRIRDHYRTVYYPLEHIIHGYRKESYKNLRMLGFHLKSSISYFNKWGWFRDQKRIRLNKGIAYTWDARSIIYKRQFPVPGLSPSIEENISQPISA